MASFPSCFAVVLLLLLQSWTVIGGTPYVDTVLQILKPGSTRYGISVPTTAYFSYDPTRGTPDTVGTVRWYANGVWIANWNVNSNGLSDLNILNSNGFASATFTINYLPPSGTAYRIDALYHGDANFQESLITNAGGNSTHAPAFLSVFPCLLTVGAYDVTPANAYFGDSWNITAKIFWTKNNLIAPTAINQTSFHHYTQGGPILGWSDLQNVDLAEGTGTATLIMNGSVLPILDNYIFPIFTADAYYATDPLNPAYNAYVNRGVITFVGAFSNSSISPLYGYPTSYYNDYVTITHTVRWNPNAPYPPTNFRFYVWDNSQGNFPAQGLGFTMIDTVKGEGNVSWTTPYLLGNTYHNFNLGYADDNANFSSYGNENHVTQLVLQAPLNTTSVTVLPSNTSRYGDSLTFGATFQYPANPGIAPINPSPSISVYYDGNALVVSLFNVSTPSTGFASMTPVSTTLLPVGVHTITAQWGYDQNYVGTQLPVPANQTQTVLPALITTNTITCGATVTYGTGITFPATFTFKASLFGSPFTNEAIPTSHVVGFYDGIPNGNINLLDVFDLANVVNSAGTATSSGASIRSLSGGVHTMYAQYLPVQSFTGGQKTPFAANCTQTVNRATVTTATVTSSPASARFGDVVTFTATFTSLANPPDTPTTTGTVQFFDGATNLAVGDFTVVNAGAGTGSATATYTALSVGTGHQIQAIYTGDINYVGAQTAVAAKAAQTIIQAFVFTISVNSTNPDANSGQTVTLSATFSFTPGVPLAPTATNKVSFYNGALIAGNVIATVSLSNIDINAGTATATTNTITLSNGAHTISAQYGSDTNFIGSQLSPTAATLTQRFNTGNVKTVTVGVDGDLTTSPYGSYLLLFANFTYGTFLSPQPTTSQKVVFYDGLPPTTPLGTTDLINTDSLTGSASAVLRNIFTLSLGPHTIYAQFISDNNYNGIQANPIAQWTITITQGAVTTSLVSTSNSATQAFFGDPLTFNAQFNFASDVTAPTASQKVDFWLDSQSNIIGTVDLTNIVPALGQAAASLSGVNSLSLGTHQIGCIYKGDSNWYGMQQNPVVNWTITIVQGKVTTTSITSSKAPSKYGDNLTFIAHFNFAPNAPAPPLAQTSGGAPTVQFYNGVPGVDGTVIGTSNLMSINLVAGTAQATITNINFLEVLNAWQIYAVYIGDQNWTNATTGHLSQRVDLAIVTCNGVTTVPPVSTFYGMPVDYYATFTFTPGVPTAPTGSNAILFYDVTPANAFGPRVTLDFIDTVTGTANATFSGYTGLTPSGAHTVYAVFGSDPRFTGQAGSGSITLAKVNITTASVTSSNDHSKFGDALFFTATFTFPTNLPAPPTSANSVGFYEGSTRLGSFVNLVSINLAAGTATATSSGITFLTVGMHNISALFVTDTNYVGQQIVPILATVSQLVDQADLVTASVGAMSSPAKYGDVVTLRANFTFTPGVATNPSSPLKVTFYEGPPPTTPIVGSPVSLTLIDKAAGTASAFLSLSTLSTGNHLIYAQYSNDTNFQGKQASVVAFFSENIQQADVLTVSIDASPLTIIYGNDIMFTAHFSWTPNTVVVPSSVAKVTVTNGVDIFGVADLVSISGSTGTALATFHTSILQVGSYPVFAIYGMDNNFVGVQQAVAPNVTVTVNQGNVVTTSIRATPDFIHYGDSVTIEANFTFTTANVPVLPTSSGHVLFFDSNPATVVGYGDFIITGSGTGKSFFTSSILNVSNKSINAVYIPDRNFQGVQDTVPVWVELEIDQAPILTVSVTSSSPICNFGDTLTFHAKFSLTGGLPLTPTLINSILFYDNSESNSIGLVDFTDFDVVSGTGMATLSGVNFLTVGAHDIGAKFKFDSDHNFIGVQADPVPNSQPQQVNQAIITTVSIVSSSTTTRYGDPITFWAAFTFTPNVVTAPFDVASVSFYDGDVSNSLGLVNLENINITAGTATATFTTSIALEVGSHIIYAGYSGDGNFVGATVVAVSQQVLQALVTTVGITSDSPTQTSHYGDLVLFEAFFTFRSPDLLVAPTASQKVTFYDGFNTSVATTDLVNINITEGTASASIWINFLLVGNHDLYAVYGNDAHFIGDQALPITFTIKHSVQRGVIDASAIITSKQISTFPEPVTFTCDFTFTPNVALPPTATSSVTFYDTDPSHPLGLPVNLQDINVTAGTASASYTTTSLLVGDHPIFAMFGSDAQFTGVVSVVGVVQTVHPDIIRTSSLVSSSPIAHWGDALTFFVTFSWAAGGVAPDTTHQATFFDQEANTTIGTVNLTDVDVVAGTASATLGLSTIQTLSIGTHTITVQFVDDAAEFYFGGQITPSVHVVQSIIKALVVGQIPTSSTNPSVYLSKVTFTIPFTFTPDILIAPTGTGLVTVYDGPTPLGTTDLISINVTTGTASATFQTTTLAYGDHKIYAVYGNDAKFNGYTNKTISFITQTVVPGKSHGVPTWLTINPDGLRAVLKGSNITFVYKPTSALPTFTNFWFKEEVVPYSYAYAPALATTQVYQIASSTGVKLTFDKALIVRLFLYVTDWPTGTYTSTGGTFKIESQNQHATLSANKKVITVSGGKFSGILSFPAGSSSISWQGAASNKGLITYSLGVLTPLVTTTLSLPAPQTKTVHVAVGKTATVTAHIRTTVLKTIPTQGAIKFTFQGTFSSIRSGPQGSATFITPPLTTKGTFPLLIEFPQIGKYDAAAPITVSIVVN